MDLDGEKSGRGVGIYIYGGVLGKKGAAFAGRNIAGDYL